MIPKNLAERIIEMGYDPHVIYTTKTAKAGLEGNNPVPWMKGFFFIDKDDEKKGFIMDAASFVPVIALSPKSGERILDMAAAPGMKTVLVGKLMKNRGEIIACEVDRKRIMRLGNNISKFNCDICKTVRCDASRYKIKSEEEKFDKILLDAPCSGEGMVTKQKKMFKVWSEKRIMKLQKIQKRLIKHGFELLKDNGTLVYSTCTFAPEENEEVVEWLVENFNAEPENIEIPNMKYSNGIKEWRGKVFSHHDKFIRIWPFQNNTNGMFVARLRKI